MKYLFVSPNGWERVRKSVTAIKICLQISLLILSEENQLVVSLCKIEPIDVILVYFLLILNHFQHHSSVFIVYFEKAYVSLDISCLLQ